MTKPTKKSKRKEQHQRAIAGYKQWEKAHPRATHQMKFDMFDQCVDTSLVEEIFHSAVQATAA